MSRRLALALALLLALSGVSSAQNTQSYPVSAVPTGTASGDLLGTYPGPRATGMQRALCSIRTANFNSTADQACTIPATISKYAISAIYVTNCSGSVSVALGGFYTAASKGGTTLVAATQAYAALTGATVMLPVTLQSGIVTTTFAVNTLYLSLTLVQGSAMTCDVFIAGLDLT